MNSIPQKKSQLQPNSRRELLESTKLSRLPERKPFSFEYKCSFCLRTLPSGGHRFDGFGACPRCYRLAHLFVNALRRHRANYFSLGVRK